MAGEGHGRGMGAACYVSIGLNISWLNRVFTALNVVYSSDVASILNITSKRLDNLFLNLSYSSIMRKWKWLVVNTCKCRSTISTIPEFLNSFQCKKTSSIYSRIVLKIMTLLWNMWAG